MVLNVENVLKLQADHETLLQLNGVDAFGALRVRAGEVGAGDHASPLREEVVTALHCGKQPEQSGTPHPWPQQAPSYRLLYNFPSGPETQVGKESLSPFYRRRNCSLVRGSDLTKVTHPVICRVNTQRQ